MPRSTKVFKGHGPSLLAMQRAHKQAWAIDPRGVCKDFYEWVRADGGCTRCEADAGEICRDGQNTNRVRLSLDT